jgi:hypothetical protein
MWKSEVSTLTEKIQGKGSSEEETKLIDKAICNYVGLMVRETLKVTSISACLLARDPSIERFPEEPP